MQKLPAGGYSESYDKPNDGISIKISTSPGGPVTQFEFTWDSPNINYDISHINGNPFESYGESLVPSGAGASGYPSCVALSCPAGTSTCNDAYNQPDDIQTRVCPDSSDLTLTLCPGGSASNPPSVSSAKGSAAASSVVASPVFSQPAFSVPAASPSSQPAFSKTTAVPVSQPGYSAPAASASSQPAYFSFTNGEFSRTAAVQASTPVAAVPSSFQTSTTPAAKQPAETSFQAQPSTPAAPNASQNSPVAAASTPAAQAPTASTPVAAAPAPTHSWSWGNWGGNWGGHQHVRRVHSHHFRL